MSLDEARRIAVRAQRLAAWPAPAPAKPAPPLSGGSVEPTPPSAFDRLVGRIDPVVDRREGVLRVSSVHWQPGAEPVDLAPALHSLADWRGAREVADPPAGGTRRRSAG